MKGAMRELQKDGDSAPYYLAYDGVDMRTVTISATLGALVESSDVRRRVLDVDMRVGSPALDNTRPGVDAEYFQGFAELPLEDDSYALRSVLWLATDAAYKRARERLIRVRAERNVGMARDNDVSDFGLEDPIRHVESPASIDVDRAGWERRIGLFSTLFSHALHVERSFVRLELSVSTRTFAASDGSTVQTARRHARIAFGASATAPDGSPLARTDELDAHAVERLPADAVVRGRIRRVIDELAALSAAPSADPAVGPAILDGKAAAVFFHEIFGHRVEGHRQRGEREGQTFADQVGQRVMSPLFDIYDDPTIATFNGVDLDGHYLIDSEGVPATSARLIRQGVFRGFLMSRTPVRGFARSNGHGRRQPGYRPVARQGNLIVDPARVTTRGALRDALLAEIRRQRRPFGFRVAEVAGGYTTTERGDPQAFVIQPVMVFKVFPDGREQLVRGVSLEGTPLSVLSNIMAARQIEVTREDVLPDRAPLLPPPPRDQKPT
ncbi:MAG: metallopeptidase TldD-related protein [Polyangiaceae bacterium]|nr:metallopeptidase TldD-related protein [Polyangiaceae bacterium]